MWESLDHSPSMLWGSPDPEADIAGGVTVWMDHFLQLNGVVQLKLDGLQKDAVIHTDGSAEYDPQ